jgi:cation diffusion facilitator family transporter
VPLWIAFTLARRRPSERFTYGLGRVEDLAGVMIVAIILFSAIVAGHEAIDRLINPEPVRLLGWLAAAGVIGFLGNEAVAIFRIRDGRQLNSAALIDVAVDGGATMGAAEGVATAVERHLLAHIPALALAHVLVRPDNLADGHVGAHDHDEHDHAGHHAGRDPAPG